MQRDAVQKVQQPILVSRKPNEAYGTSGTGHDRHHAFPPIAETLWVSATKGGGAGEASGFCLRQKLWRGYA